MNKKYIKKLALASYTNNILDSKKIERISKNLKRLELKDYIKFLKAYENGKKVIVLTSDNKEKNNILKKIKKLFPNKEIIVKEDKSLIGGIKILDNDLIYGGNIKDTLTNLTLFINK